MTVAVVTDSAADLPRSLAGSLGIRVIPLVVSFGDRSFLDGEDLTPAEFWTEVETDPAFPSTASPPPAAFARAYADAAAHGISGVVSVHLSGALSRTVQSASAAAREAPIPVEVVDARAVSLGEGVVALAAAWAARAGGTLEQVAALARSCPDRTRMFAMIDSVDFLRRGGRLGAARAALTDLLRIRPVFTMVDGEPELVARARTRSRAIAEVLERSAGPAEAAGVIHSGAPEAAEIMDRVRASAGVEPIETQVGAVIGCHLGPKAVGVVVLSREDSEPPGGTE